MLLLVLPYANPIMGVMEENKEIEETVVYFYGEKMCLTLIGTWAVSVREATSTGHTEAAEEIVSLVSSRVLLSPLQALFPSVTKTDLTNEKSSLFSENLMTDCHSRDSCLALLGLFRAGGGLTKGERHGRVGAGGCCNRLQLFISSASDV